MRAIVCRAYGPLEDLELVELPDEAPAEGQVAIDVRAAGVNFPDALLVQGRHQIKPALPFTPGGEIAGVVSAVGSGVAGLQPGQSVIATRIRGGYASRLLAPAAHVRPMPAALSFEEAAALSVVYETSWFSLIPLARLRAGETLLVLGAAGGVGLAAVEIGVACGARVIAAASSAEKLAVCRAHGAAEAIDYTREPLKERVRELTSGRGVDVVYDPVGGAYAEPALRALAWLGRYLVVGFAAGDIPRVPLNLILLKNASVIGVFLGEACERDLALAREIAAGVDTLAATGKIRPLISARFPLAEARHAMERLLARDVVGKIVLTP